MNEVSEKQLDANRRNAKLGGVKTEEGKEASKMNALRHGLLSKEIVLATENASDLLDLEKRMRADLNPVGELEYILVDRIVSSLWRLRRAMAIERAAMSYQRNHKDAFDLPFLSTSPEQKEDEQIKAMIFNEDFDKLIRYENSLERSIYRALHELQRLQAARNGERPPAPIAIDIETTN
jgi:hypothetical protein